MDNTIYEQVKDFPEMPGVYLMKDHLNKVIYIGKAKLLKKRVISYFTGLSSKDLKTQELVKNIHDIEYIITQNEVDALLLENNLIKRYSPRYNILLKDQKTYPYIMITKEKFPKLEIIRDSKKLKSKNTLIFGPYTSGVKYIIKIIQRIFKIRDCKINMNKDHKRPCLKHHMGMCLGVCVYKNLKDEYNENITSAIQLLKGHNRDLTRKLEKDMEKYAKDMEFEQAIKYREKLAAIKQLDEKQVAEYGKSIDEDVFLLKVENEKMFSFVLNIRSGKIIGRNFFKNSLNAEFNDETFISLFFQYYTKYPIPKNIILSNNYKYLQELIEDGLKKIKNSNVNLFFPAIQSRRKELFDMAEKNLDDKIEKYFLSKKVLTAGLNHLKDKLKTKKTPLRIECFDISNIQGKDAVGSMSVAIQGKMEKSEYRRFKIKTKVTPDDFFMMQEVLTRRYSKLQIEDLPDLILIDGGKGQLSIAERVLKKLEKDKYLDIISIAKKEEIVFKSGENEPFRFKNTDEALKILQRLRDESHRFGITYHKKLRNKRVISSELDKIDGIGAVRKKDLLNRFKTIKAIKEANIDELKMVVPENVALNIKNLL